MQYTFEQIEDLKRQYTDKFVLVDASRPELRRFHGETGRVKTVNMSGRALVEFDWSNNIGWFDIGLDYLRVVDGPVPKLEKSAKPEPEKASSDQPAAKAKPEGAAAAAAGAKPASAAGPAKKSTADILAAARAAKAEGAAAPAAKAPAAKAPSAKAPSAKAPAAKPAGGGKLSTADILAAARAAKQHAAEEQPAPVAEDSEAEAEVAELEAEAAAEVIHTPAPPAAKAPAGALPKTVPEIIAWCRQHDAK